MFREASTASLIGFLFICAFVAGALIWGVWKTRREWTLPVAIGTVIWLGAILLVVGSRWLEGDQRRVLLFAASMNLMSLGVGLSPIGRWLSLVPLPILVAFQGFRLPLELVLHSWVGQGVIPETMTWTGRNWDIISGVVALVCAPLCRRSRASAWFANAVGLVLLLNVMRVAVLSSPLSFGWAIEPKLALIYHVPYALIVPVCIGGALIGHVVLTRALLRTT